MRLKLFEIQQCADLRLKKEEATWECYFLKRIAVEIESFLPCGACCQKLQQRQLSLIWSIHWNQAGFPLVPSKKKKKKRLELCFERGKRGHSSWKKRKKEKEEEEEEKEPLQPGGFGKQ